MALALNVFRTVTSVVGLSTVGIYTAPVGYSGVVLLASCTNTGNSAFEITFNHKRTTAGIAVTTELLKDYPVPANDTVNMLSGKLILESGDVLEIRGSDTLESQLKFVGSILETLN